MERWREKTGMMVGRSKYIGMKEKENRGAFLLQSKRVKRIDEFKFF